MNTYVAQQDIQLDIVILYVSSLHSNGEEAVIYKGQILTD
jgi:hypothetical protein